MTTDEWQGRSPRSCGLVVLLLFWAGISGSACSYSSSPTKIGPAFLVEVADRGKPIGGLQIELDTDPGAGDGKSRTVSIVTTDANGRARFKNVRPRLYYVGIRHPAFAYSIEIKVVRVPPKGSSETITFEWPGVKPIFGQSASGVLQGHARTERGFGPDLLHPIYRAVFGAKLTLSKAVPNEVVESQLTQTPGTFSFQPIPAGLYLLRIESTNTRGAQWFYPLDGYIPIEIDPSAKISSVNLYLDQAAFGELGYENREEKIQ